MTGQADFTLDDAGGCVESVVLFQTDHALLTLVGLHTVLPSAEELVEKILRHVERGGLRCGGGLKKVWKDDWMMVKKERGCDWYRRKISRAKHVSVGGVCVTKCVVPL